MTYTKAVDLLFQGSHEVAVSLKAFLSFILLRLQSCQWVNCSKSEIYVIVISIIFAVSLPV